jgi:thiol-disulfide isomerase/thioredoxin
MRMSPSCPPHHQYQPTSSSSSIFSCNGRRLRHGHCPRRIGILSQGLAVAFVLSLGSLFMVQQVHSFQPQKKTIAHAHVYTKSNHHSIHNRLLEAQRMFELRPLPAAVVVQENEYSSSDSSEPDATSSTTSLQRSATAATQAKAVATQSSPVQDFDTPLQFLEALSLLENNSRFIVVKYYATYCKICQRAAITYKKIATEQQQQQLPHPVDFYGLDAGRLPGDTLRTLGVTKFPFVQIFFQGDCVASFSTGANPSHLFGQRVQSTVDTCLTRTPDEWEAFRIDFAGVLNDNREARDAVRDSLMQSATTTTESN